MYQQIIDPTEYLFQGNSVQNTSAQEFITKGYLIVKNVFDAEECLAWKNELLLLIEEGKKALEQHKSKNENRPMDREILADLPHDVHRGMFQDIAHRKELFMSIAKDKRITNVVKPILGNDISLYRSLSVFKDAT